MSGFKISIDKISEYSRKLILQLVNHNTNVIDELPLAINFFNEFLYKYSDKENECLRHFHKVYKELPKESNYYFNVEEYSYKDGGVFQRFCYPIGVGENEIDALSTYRLNDTISAVRPSGVTSNLNGHFVKATFEGDKLIFETIEDNYDLKLRSVNIERNKKLERLVMAYDFDDSNIPEDLKYTLHWSGIAKKYDKKIKEQKIYDDLEKFNKELQETEKKFHKSVKLYRDYKKQLASAQKNTAMINLIMKGASFAADNFSKDVHTKNFNILNSKIDNLILESEKAKNYAKQQKNNINFTLINIKNTYINNNVPLNDNDIPDDKWNNILP